MKAKLALLFVLSTAGTAFADSVSLDLNDDALRVNYQHALNENYQSDIAWIHVQDLGNTFTGGLTLSIKPNNDISAQVGGKAVFQQHDTLPDGTAIAVGGTVRITPAADKKIALALTGYFAPNVLSFGDMDNYREFEIRGEYNVSEQLTAYVGYRNNRADYESSNIKASGVKLYDGAMIGGEFHF
jgi:predicted porin